MLNKQAQLVYAENSTIQKDRTTLYLPGKNSNEGICP